MNSEFIICTDINGKKYKAKKDELKFRPSVYGLIFKNNKILLSKAWDGYDFPGGGINKGEKTLDALKREVWEETGIKVTPGALVNVYEDFFVGVETPTKFHTILMYYLCANPTGKISRTHMDKFEKTYLGAAEWIDLKDIKKIKFYNGINSPELIRMALKVKNHG